MFGVDTSELLIVAILALLFIGPKELPRAMMTVGRFVGKMRGYARHFTSGIENVIREAELEEMDRKWREQNAAILAQHPADAVYPEPGAGATTVDPASAPVMMPLEPTPDVMPPIVDEPLLPLEIRAAPDDDPRPPRTRPLP